MLSSGPPEAELGSVGRHFQYWKGLVERGTALSVGRTQTSTPDTMGLAVFMAEDEAEASLICEADPAVMDGVFTMRLFPYFIALLGDPAPFQP